jgi:hypothetical protein
MAEKDKVLKSGQITLPRLLFLALVGGVIVLMVYYGGVWLSVGYWLITLSICALLFMIAIDYGVNAENIDLATAQTVPADTTASIAAPAEVKAAAEVRPKRRTTRATKRRR